MNGSKTSQTGLFLCVACGKHTKPHADGILCPSCQKNYKAGAVDALIKGTAIQEWRWAVKMGEKVLDSAIAEVNEMQKEYTELQGRVRDMADARLMTIPGVRELNSSIVNGAIQKLKDEFWGNEGGHRLHAKFWSTKSLVEELKDQIRAIKVANSGVS